ncbi:electron transport complex subunit RsxC [Gayadomonas joobiniege]|uniref:electron transport complex subunit RsxC n=1 Tax=Gayadomonas joobiniege TaxID=1234606 RepID=UPI00035E5541|nr:electron transport complex subunit RsxC [Gayadomonas joobiniege]
MDSLIKTIKSGYLWRFPGGVHPPQKKSLSQTGQIKRPELASKYYVSLKQHIGQQAEACVQVGDKVKKGQMLSRADTAMQLPVHAPTSGIVTDIREHILAHPSGLGEQTIIIEADGSDEWCQREGLDNYQQLPPAQILDKIKSLGVAGLGGAGFPTHIKNSRPEAIELLIINGAECEPYITADDALMREHAADIVAGINILNHLLEAKLVVIAIEDNKPEAIKAMELASADEKDIIVRVVPTKYPTGGEKQLIQVLTGKEVPSGGIPADIGIVMQNVATAYSTYRAVIHGEPLIERVVTLTGESISQAGNYWVRIGTPVAHILTQAGYNQPAEGRLIMGGPMMGFSIHSPLTPVSKITNCLLAPAMNELPDPADEQACIRCGYCADACPASLLPQQLYWHSKAREYEKAQHFDLFDCIECGACAYVCPSEIPLVQYYRVAKANIRQQAAENEKAEKAKERFNQRQLRLEEEKQARIEKQRLAAEKRKQTMQEDASAKDKIAQALARAQAQKASRSTDQAKEQAPAQSTIASDSKNNSPKSAAQAAIARAKAKKAAAQKADNEAMQSAADTDQSDIEKTAKEKAQAAIARAKAKKAAAQKADNEAMQSAADTKQSDTGKTAKEKAQAAIARAKAKKAAAQKVDNGEHANVVEPIEQSDPKTPEPTVDKPASGETNQMSQQDDKSQRIKAAIAKAKAKRKQLGGD